jgi:hypothetical protein
MSVKLEKYLAGRRKDLDVESPDDATIWDGIQRRLETGKMQVQPTRKRQGLIRIRNIAAAAIILFSFGYIANDIINGRNNVRVITLSSIDSELGRKEAEYKTLINYKTEEVRAFTGSNDINVSELFEEIKKLDVIYNGAMNDLRELGPNEKVINTIFNTYEQRIRLLELIILETNKLNNHENKEKSIL